MNITTSLARNDEPCFTYTELLPMNRTSRSGVAMDPAYYAGFFFCGIIVFSELYSDSHTPATSGNAACKVLR